MHWRRIGSNHGSGGLRRRLQSVRSVVRGMKYFARRNAQDQCGCHGKHQRSSHRQSHVRPGNRGMALIVLRLLRRDQGQAQIVGRSQSRVEQADDGQPYCASANGCGEGVELAEESAGERDADQRNQKENQPLTRVITAKMPTFMAA